MGAKWLRNGGKFHARNSGGKGEDPMDKESPEKVAQPQQLSIKSGIGMQAM